VLNEELPQAPFRIIPVNSLQGAGDRFGLALGRDQLFRWRRPSGI
jgi:hypothetical protein